MSILNYNLLDAEGNIISAVAGEEDVINALLGTDFQVAGQRTTSFVDSIVELEQQALPEPDTDYSRRIDRRLEFSATLDLVNPIWFNALTTTQQSSLAAWRTLWLDYPNDLTLTRPVRPEGMFIE